MGFFNGSGDDNFDPTNWIDHNIYEDVMSDNEVHSKLVFWCYF